MKPKKQRNGKYNINNNNNNNNNNYNNWTLTSMAFGEKRKLNETKFIGKWNKLHEKLKGKCKYNKFGIQGIFESDKLIYSSAS